MAHFHTVHDPRLSAAPLRIANLSEVEAAVCPPPCNCPDCQTGFYCSEEQYRPNFAYRNKLPDSKVVRIAGSYIQQIEATRTRLKRSLELHADALVSRWRKASPGKRQELLKNVAPEVEEQQWVLPRYSYMEERKDFESRNLRRRRHLLLPWLNVEVLQSNPVILFALLHFRTVYAPQDWAAFDCRQIELSWACGWLDVEFSSKCMVMYGPRYGDIVDWKEDSAHRADILGFPRARLVLEAQAYLMTLLWRIADKILEGVDDSNPVRTEKWKEQITAGLRRIGEVELWSPYTAQAFSRPPIFDIDYLVSLAKTRMDASRDHITDMQCNLKYLRQHMKHLFGMSIFKNAGDNDSAFLLASELYEDVNSYYWWRWVEIECRHVQQLHSRFSDSTHSGSPIPYPYDRALGALELLLVNQVIYRAQCLERLLPYAPGFSKNWTIQRGADLPEGSFKLMRNSLNNTKESLADDPLDWCLVQMLGLPDEQTHFDHAMLFAFLEDHLASSPRKEASRLDELLLRKLSDISACHEALVSVRLQRPLNTSRVIEEAAKSEDREGWKRLRNGISMLPRQGFEEAGTHLVQNFYKEKPPNGPKNLKWLEQRQILRCAVEGFWNIMQSITRESFRASAFNQKEIDNLLKVVSANATAEYRNAVAKEEEEIKAQIQNDQTRPSDNFQDWVVPATEPGSRWTLPILREKVKTRPEGTDAADGTSAEPEPPNGDVSPSEPIVVPAHALVVFDLMFPGAHEETGRSVKWDDFVQAMCDAGFKATNNGGSVVRFERTTSLDKGEGAIVFHRPHPVPKLDSIMLRGMGRRMAKWFDWSRERFVLEDGGQAAEAIGT